MMIAVERREVRCRNGRLAPFNIDAGKSTTFHEQLFICSRDP